MSGFRELAPSQHRPMNFHNGFSKGHANVNHASLKGHANVSGDANGYSHGLSPDSDHSDRTRRDPSPAPEKYYEADFEFSPIAAPYVVAADNVLFGVSEMFMGQSSLFLREMPHLSANSPLHLEEHVTGTLNSTAVRVFVRMVEIMVQPAHSPDAVWRKSTGPTVELALMPNTDTNMELLGVALQLALELKCNAAYRHTLALLHLLVSDAATSPVVVVNIFCLASGLDEEALAAVCAARLAQIPSHADYWTWTPQVAHAVPSPYIWSLQRALHTPKQLPADETDTINNTVAAAFLASLAEIKG